MTQRVVIVGATGHIGRPLCRELLRAGNLVTVFSRGWTPWIHIADEVGVIAFALEQAGFDGPVNLTAPTPVRAREFARVLGRTVDRWPGCRYPPRSSGWAWA